MYVAKRVLAGQVQSVPDNWLYFALIIVLTLKNNQKQYPEKQFWSSPKYRVRVELGLEPMMSCVISGG